MKKSYTLHGFTINVDEGGYAHVPDEGHEDMIFTNEEIAVVRVHEFAGVPLPVTKKGRKTSSKKIQKDVSGVVTVKPGVRVKVPRAGKNPQRDLENSVLTWKGDER